MAAARSMSGVKGALFENCACQTKQLRVVTHDEKKRRKWRQTRKKGALREAQGGSCPSTIALRNAVPASWHMAGAIVTIAIARR